MFIGGIKLLRCVILYYPPEPAVTSTTEPCNKEIKSGKSVFFHEGNPKSQILYEDQVVRKSLESGNKLFNVTRISMLLKLEIYGQNW